MVLFLADLFASEFVQIVTFSICDMQYIRNESVKFFCVKVTSIRLK